MSELKAAAEIFGPTGPLMIGVSTRAIFDLEEEHHIFEKEGIPAYASLQRHREGVPLQPGAAFEVIRRLLALNKPSQSKLVDVVFLSRNSPDLSLRAFESAKHHGLDITRGSFTSGRPLAPYGAAWSVDLFLSNEDDDVKSAARSGLAAATLSAVPAAQRQYDPDEVRIALDGDSVIFDEKSDLVYKERKLDGFLAHEVEHAQEPMGLGPLGNFFMKLAALRERTKKNDGTSYIRIALVTARNAPAHERVVKTFRAWGSSADEAHFCGAHDKGRILKAFGAHIFFDDQQKHVENAAAHVPAGLVPGPHDPGELVIHSQ